MRFLELLESTATDEPNSPAPPAQQPVSSKVYFHVTTKQRLKSIQANGLEPNHKRRWKTGFGKQLGDRGNIYIMSDFTAAVRWAFKQQWEHYAGKPPSPSPYVIVCLRENPENLEPDPHPENGLYGHSWYQKTGGIAPEDILKIIPLTPELIKQVINGGEAVMEDSLTGLGSNYSPTRCMRLLAARGWEETSIPNNFSNAEYPEYSIDLDIHSVDSRGPFTVLRGGRKLAVTKEPPFAQQLGLKDRLI